jgi:hypothetical protein
MRASDLITRRSQVQILPPLLEKPRKRGFSVLMFVIGWQNFCPTFAFDGGEAFACSSFLDARSSGSTPARQRSSRLRALACRFICPRPLDASLDANLLPPG